MKSEQLKAPPDVHGPVTARTTDSIKADYLRYECDGGNLKRAKFFNNAIRKPFFENIPLSQVCPPGLHITLGVFLRLFVLLEDAAHELDLRFVVQNDKGGASYERLIQRLHEQTQLKDEELSLSQLLKTLGQHLILLANNLPATVSTPNQQLTDLWLEITDKTAERKQVQEKIAKIEAELVKGFKKEDGPFVRALDAALASFHVQRQAYYSGTFVGNHVHSTLKPANLRVLCSSLEEVALRNCPELLSEVEKVAERFQTAFTLFRHCHTIYDKKMVDSTELVLLEQNIKAFMNYYREKFTYATVLPKMHILEEHVVPWIRMWGVGFGLMGEQGAESIHTYFNTLKRTYSSIPDRVQRLKYTMKEHLLHVSPVNIVSKPAVKKRKFKE